MYRTFHNYTNFLHNMSTLSFFLLKLCQFGQASYTYECLMLFDLRKKIMLMIKDISELVQGQTLCKSCSMGVITSDWEKKGCPFSGGW